MVGMISSISVRNFQRNRRLKIKLSRRITTIIGPTNVGKSALLRAMRWALLNKGPRKFLTKGETEARVILVVDGKKLTRRQGEENSYTLDGKKYVAFGKDMPKEVADFLKVVPLNIQQQIDSSFWFRLSPGEVSRELNSIVDLGEIDSTLANLAAMLRSTKAEQAVVASRLSDAVAEKRELRWALIADHELRNVERLERSWQKAQEQREELEELLDEAEKHRSAARKWASLPQARQELEKLERLSGSVGAASQRRAELEELLDEVEHLERTRRENKRSLKKLHSELDELMGDSCPLCRQPILVPF